MPNMRIRVREIRYRNEDTKYTVFTATLMKHGKRAGWQDTQKKSVFVGQLMLCIPNDQFEVEAELVESEKYGEQYAVSNYHRIEPGTILEIKRFLINSTKGLGAVKAEALTSKYGLDTLNVLRSDPLLLNSLKLSDNAKRTLYEALMMGEEFEKLLTFFRLHGLDHRYVLPLYERYQEYALDKLQDDPYSAYLDDIIPFKLADDIAFCLDKPYNFHGRVLAAVLAAIRSEAENSGNVYVVHNDLFIKVMRFLFRNHSKYNEFPPISKSELSAALEELVDRRWIATEATSVETRIYLRVNLEAENHGVEYLWDVLNGTKSTFYDKADISNAIDHISGVALAPKQRDAVTASLTSPVSILTGGPGTGKTQTVSAMLQVIKTITPNAEVKLCAPTGKAAARMSELTGTEASTIHRLLGIGNPQKALSIGELCCDFLIIDEFSMVDIQLFEQLFRCVGTNTRVIIVGDDNQLPSVGPGLVLRDLINSRIIPVTKLTQVFRQKGCGNIVTNAHAIINQKSGEPINLKISNKPGGSFYFIEAESPSAIKSLICRSGMKLLKKNGIPLSQIEVLSPVHSSDLGTDALNILLQEQFNPSGIQYIDGERTFRVGDKVIHNRNDYELGVFNGETGVIKSLGYSTEAAMLVEFRDKEVWYSSLQVTELDLAYSLTVHRCQGSEYSAVIIPIHDTVVRNMNMNLLYTAITRAKGIVILIGDKKAFSEGLRRREAARASGLADKLKDAGTSAVAA